MERKHTREDEKGDAATTGATGAQVASSGGRWVVTAEVGGRQLDGAIKTLAGVAWSAARSMIETGKVKVSGVVAQSARRRVAAGEVIEIDPRAPKP
ncbi:MAG: hypothetical protein R3B70_42205, partial [Polyangiaceae bacterium]